MITSNDIAEPVTFPMGPIATPAERNLLLSQRAEGANMLLITEKSQKRRNTNSKKTQNLSVNSSSKPKTNEESSKKTTNLRKRKISKLDSSEEDESSDDELAASSEVDKNEKLSSSGDSTAGSEDSEYDLDKFTYLTNKLHYDEDDKRVYKTTRVVEENGFIVVYRKKRYSNGKFFSKEERSPIYAKDVVEYTKLYDRMNE